MSLRARLLASLAVMLVVALVAAGFLLVELTRASLVDRVDRDLLALSGPGNQLQRFGNLAGLGQRCRPPPGDPAPRPRREGRAVVPVGVRERSRSPARPPRLHGRDPVRRLRPIVERPSVDGSMHYRAILQRSRPSSTTLAIAAPLAGVDAAVGGARPHPAAHRVDRPHRSPRRRLGRRPPRPAPARAHLARRPRTSRRGDLTPPDRRAHDKTEVGRLGTAFDAMLDRIETSFGEQQAALDAKAASEERLRRFVADASHELRTPLTAVRGYSDLYRAGGLSDPDELATAMARIGTESRRMGALVDDLLLLARLDQGRPIRQDPVDLSRIATDAVADARALDPGRPIVAAIDPGVVVAGDEDRLRQVVGNLLANVRVHTPAETPVEVVAQSRRRRGRASGRRPRTGHRRRGRLERLRPLLPRRSRAIARQWGHRARAVDRGGRHRGPRAGGSGTRPRRAAGRPSSCGFHSQQVHSRRTVRLQRT